MQDDEILKIAHRTAWKYKHSTDPHHSDTYTFNNMCMIDFARKVLNGSAVEPIGKNEIDLALDAILVASGSALKRYTMPSTLEIMRHTMLQIMKKSYADGSNACHRAMITK